jgi:hypothetical protein
MRSVVFKVMWVGKLRALMASVVAVMVALSIGLLPAEPGYASTTFVVNSTGDANDTDFPGGAYDGSSDDSCDTGGTLMGPRGAIIPECTYRAAIQQANTTTDADVINFGIPASDPGRNATTGVFTITPNTFLPGLFQPVTINGYSQPGAEANSLRVGNDAKLLIELNGSTAAAATVNPVAGVSIGEFTSNMVVKGLVINRFDNGVFIGSHSSGHTIEGNFIGTDPSGKQAPGNLLGGVAMQSSSNNTVGGTQAEARNVISGNGGDGVRMLGFNEGSSGNRVRGNYIGTDASGTQDLGNSGAGVVIWGVRNSTVGGTEAGAGNIISGNDGDGVTIKNINNTAAVATGNRILGNSIFANGGLGIDLNDDGVTLNDTDTPPDADSGPNNLQNYPDIISAKKTSKGTVIKGTLTSIPGQLFAVQFFSNPSTGPDEGKKFVGQLTTVQTDVFGNAAFRLKVGRRAAPVGSTITATATDINGNTSEFSEPTAVRRA